jgi:ubiquinone biosynthesis protein UbiJ
MIRVPLPLAQVALSAMNHVLQQQPAARDQMRVHAGQQLRVVIAGPLGDVSSDARIGEDGLLFVTAPAAPAVVLTLAPTMDALFGVLGGGPRGLGPHLKVEGDVMLSAAVGKVAESLRWDFEEDLSRVVGDTVAHRVGRVVHGLRERSGGLRDRSREALERAATTRDGPLVSQRELAALADEVRRLAASISRVEARRRAR